MSLYRIIKMLTCWVRDLILEKMFTKFITEKK